MTDWKEVIAEGGAAELEGLAVRLRAMQMARAKKGRALHLKQYHPNNRYLSRDFVSANLNPEHDIFRVPNAMRTDAAAGPQPVRVGKRGVAWRESDIAAWQAGLEVGTRL